MAVATQAAAGLTVQNLIQQISANSAINKMMPVEGYNVNLLTFAFLLFLTWNCL